MDFKSKGSLQDGIFMLHHTIWTMLSPACSQLNRVDASPMKFKPLRLRFGYEFPKNQMVSGAAGAASTANRANRFAGAN